MFITVQVRNVYGNDLVYAMDEKAAMFAMLLKVKTFNAYQLRYIKALGYEIHVASGKLPFNL
jgi:hypothetical protein